MSATAIGDEAVWHDVECGAYAADLALWEGLAAEAAGPVLELGSGTGRVALHLARAGHQVIALDRSSALLAELERRTASLQVEVDARIADAREFDVGRRVACILAPMQFAHLLGGPGGRASMLAAAARCLDHGGTFAAALLGPDGAGTAGAPVAPLPDVREIDGWVYSSLPLEVRDVGAALEVRRLRQLVSPAGELSETVEVTRLDRIEPDRFEAEGEEAGLAARERLEVAPTADHVGSVICVLEARP
jgi:SAM-dependent methyltransferase